MFRIDPRAAMIKPNKFNQSKLLTRLLQYTFRIGVTVVIVLIAIVVPSFEVISASMTYQGSTYLQFEPANISHSHGGGILLPDMRDSTSCFPLEDVSRPAQATPSGAGLVLDHRESYTRNRGHGVGILASKMDGYLNAIPLQKAVWRRASERCSVSEVLGRIGLIS
jgi:hypothetical protein